jgi:hypothetical protein
MNADIHDFEITAIRTFDGSAFTLRMIGVQGPETYVTCFTNVRKLYVDGFSLQNIVLDLHFYPKPFSDFGFQRACGMLELDAAEAELALEAGSIVLIEASSGAELACLLGWQGVAPCSS